MSINYRPVQDVGSSQPVIVKSATDFGRDFDFHLLVQARNQIGISDCQLEQDKIPTKKIPIERRIMTTLDFVKVHFC